MDCIDLAAGLDRRRALVIAVRNLRFHEMRAISVLYENRLAPQEGICSVEFVVVVVVIIIIIIISICTITFVISMLLCIKEWNQQLRRSSIKHEHKHHYRQNLSSCSRAVFCPQLLYRS